MGEGGGGTNQNFKCLRTIPYILWTFELPRVRIVGGYEPDDVSKIGAGGTFSFRLTPDRIGHYSVNASYGRPQGQGTEQPIPVSCSSSVVFWSVWITCS